MKRGAVSIVLLFFAVAAPSPVAADLYKWTDKNGIVHFGSQPGDPSAELLKEKDLAPMSETGAPSPDVLTEKTVFPGSVTVTVRLFFDGKPFSEVTSVPAVIRLYNQQLKQWIIPDYSYNAGTGTFLINGVAEGRYAGQVTADADRSNPDQYPGDYKGTIAFTATTSSPVVAFSEMERIIHLTSPEDNGVSLPDWGEVCSNKTVFEAPVAIAWEPLGKDVVYSYSIVKTVCAPFEFKGAVAADKTAASRVVLDLPPSKEGEFYTLRLEAQKSDRIVGTFVTHGKNGWGWDYRFRVLPKRGPTRVISPAQKQ